MTKLALLFGLNYVNSDNKLNGCINDINNTKEMLSKHFGYIPENIKVLTDETNVKPTYNNMIKALYNLSSRTITETIDEVWISYSGHGSYVKDSDGDEDDGKDEVLVPLDYKTSGMIKDDFLHDIISKINKKTHVTIVIDACHSETMIDLPYRYIQKDSQNVIENKYSKLSGHDIIMVSGCRDDQTSADAWNVENSREYSGAMTSSLLHVLDKNNYNITCSKLLEEMRIFLKDRNYKQVPQICCSYKLDDKKMFNKKNNNVIDTGESSQEKPTGCCAFWRYIKSKL